jgi:hypothetical protein
MYNTMYNTKHDLSADEVQLDYMVMREVAIIAMRQCRDQLERCLNETYDLHPQFGNTSRCSNAERMEELSTAYKKAVVTFYALDDGLTRSIVTIVNKPEVRE